MCDGHHREVLASRISGACRFLKCPCVLLFVVPVLHLPVHARSEGLAVSGDAASSPNPGFVLPQALVQEDEASWSKKAVEAHEHERLRSDGALGSAAEPFTLRDEETLRYHPLLSRAGGTVVLNRRGATEEAHVVSNFTPNSLVITSGLALFPSRSIWRAPVEDVWATLISLARHLTPLWLGYSLHMSRAQRFCLLVTSIVTSGSWQCLVFVLGPGCQHEPRPAVCQSSGALMVMTHALQNQFRLQKIKKCWMIVSSFFL